MEAHLREGGMKKKFLNSRKPSHWQVCGEFWNLGGQHNWEEKKKKSTVEVANHNSQQNKSRDASVCHQGVGAGQGGEV